jgi:hypothetical protein
MAVYQINWKCKYCNQSLQVNANSATGNKPSISGCPVQKGSTPSYGHTHDWKDVTSQKIGD